MHPAKPRWERRKGARPAELTAAALALFVERGYAATRLDEVATRAGVSKGTLYLYFDSKETLFKAVMQDTLLPVLAEGKHIVEQHRGASTDLVRKLMLRWWALIATTPLGSLSKLMIAEARNFPEISEFYFAEYINPAYKLFSVVLERGIASGEFSPCHTTTQGQLVFGPLILHAVWQHSISQCIDVLLPNDDYIEAAIEYTLKGLHAGTQPKGTKQPGGKKLKVKK